MIKSFKCSDTQKLFERQRVARFQAIEVQSIVKLDLIETATKIADLNIFPGNKLEKLKGDREGQYSIRINRQWRICFVWRGNEAFDVEIVDYH